MRIQNIKRGFTLIELLVVITIMGILATGATAVYTSQIQKARDSTRITDIEALKSGIEQSYQDSGTYPNAGAAVGTEAKSFIDVKTYTPKFPKDPKTGQKSGQSNFDYVYAVGSDSSLVSFQTYELSTTFENAGTVTSKAGGDGGSDANRLELGINIGTLNTAINSTGNFPTWINTNPITIGTSCIAEPAVPTVPTSAGVACLTTTTALANTSALVIK